MRCALLALWLLFASAAALADERILSYDVDVNVEADGMLDVTERITVRAEGNRIRRGIYRDFPTRYRDRYGNRVVVDLDVLSVLRDGKPEPWFTENLSNGVRINTGNDSLLPQPAQYAFTFRYRTSRQLGFFSDHDELYWNAIGTGWVFPIEQGGIEVRLPRAVPVEQMSAEGYTGYQGDRGQDFDAQLPAAGVARWRLTRPLQPNEGLTIVLSFPKGVVAAPGAVQRFVWLLKDNRGLLVALGGLLALLVYCVHEWRRVGRDPPKGVVIARYEPPAGQTPASLRYLRRMAYDARCFSSEVLALAVAGCLRIDRQDRLFKDDWTLERAGDVKQVSMLPAGQQALLERLFSGGRHSLLLKNTNAATVSAARTAHARVIDKALQPRYFKRNRGSVLRAFLIAGATAWIAFMIAGGSGIPAIVIVAIVMGLTLLVFSRLVRALTLEGRALLDEIEGLKLYLSVAERDELSRMPGPGGPPVLDAKRYEMLLPYAVALEVEDAWTEKFTAAVGVAAAAAAAGSIGWYHGGHVSDLGSFSRDVGSALSSQIASSSRPPGSSSGSGGGGSSGGGGGGGGGGGR